MILDPAVLKYELYEQAAQSPARQARFVRAVAGDRARVLGEDFCGTGALSLAWVGLGEGRRAIAVDLDPVPLGHLRARSHGAGDRIEILQADVRDRLAPVDVIATLNFSIGYFHERAELLRYLRSAHERLASAGGVFLCDVYGGVDAFACGVSDLELRGGAVYEWEQRDADPLTARVVNAMHFILENGERIEDAFVYEWRLWSVPELRDALLEAGFASAVVYDRLGDAEADDGELFVRPVPGDELDENFVVYIAARASVP